MGAVHAPNDARLLVEVLVEPPWVDVHFLVGAGEVNKRLLIGVHELSEVMDALADLAFGDSLEVPNQCVIPPSSVVPKSQAHLFGEGIISM